MNNIKEKIEWLFQQKGSTEIARETDLSQQSIHRYMRKTNPSKIGNMTLDTAEKLYNYALSLQKENPAE